MSDRATTAVGPPVAPDGAGGAPASPTAPSPRSPRSGGDGRKARGGVPVLRLGAASVGRLALPSAAATAGQLYGPRGVFFDGERVLVADTGNHRVLIWNRVPGADGEDADLILGQPSATADGPQASGLGAARGFRMPSAIAMVEGHLVLADAWNHRVLIWHGLPSTSDRAPDLVLGQPDLGACEPNRGGSVTASSLYWPYGFGFVDGTFWVADTGNRRVLGWHGLPTEDRPADHVIGQDDMTSHDENRGGAADGRSFRWPHDVAGDGDHLYVADAGNHRVLGWRGVPGRFDEACWVLGQEDAHRTWEFPYGPQDAHMLRFPYGISAVGDRLAVADTANNRILLWRPLPERTWEPAEAVLGQDDFTANGENRWLAVEPSSLCWPYGIWLHGEHLAVADSGNNRVVLWRLEDPQPHDPNPRDSQ